MTSVTPPQCPSHPHSAPVMLAFPSSSWSSNGQCSPVCAWDTRAHSLVSSRLDSDGILVRTSMNNCSPPRFPTPLTLLYSLPWHLSLSSIPDNFLDTVVLLTQAQISCWEHDKLTTSCYLPEILPSYTFLPSLLPGVRPAWWSVHSLPSKSPACLSLSWHLLESDLSLVVLGEENHCLRSRSQYHYR